VTITLRLLLLPETSFTLLYLDAAALDLTNVKVGGWGWPGREGEKTQRKESKLRLATHFFSLRTTAQSANYIFSSRALNIFDR